MINLKIYRAKRSLKRIELLKKNLLKFEYYVREVKRWINEEKEVLNAKLKELTDEEFLDFGVKNGYICSEDFEAIQKERKKK